MPRLTTILVLFLLGFPAITRAQAKPFATFTEATRFFNKNLRAPQEALDNCKTGYVLMKFDLDSAGRVTNVEKLFGEYFSLVEEVGRVIRRSDQMWNRLFNKNTVVLVPVYFIYQRDDHEPPCDSIRPTSVVNGYADTPPFSMLNQKQVIIPNGIMLSPVVVITYVVHKKQDLKLENTSSK